MIKYHMKKLFLLLVIGFFSFELLSLTGCHYKSKNSSINLESLENTLDETVQSYFHEKYDVNSEITYQHIAGGVFIGPDPSSEQYYLLTVNVKNGSETTECEVHVYGRKADGANELYVKKESYYGYVIKERMEKWLDKYVKKANIDEYYSSFFAVETILYPSEYDTNASAEEIIKSVGSIEDIKERPDLILYIIIPQSEYEKHSEIENEFSELRTHINEVSGKVDISLNVYNDEDYLKKKNSDKSVFKQLEHIKIID